MSIPKAVVRRAVISATASARSRGQDARPAQIAKMLQEKYDPEGMHEQSEWLDIARAAVQMVQAAREGMALVPLPQSGVRDNVIR